MPPIVHVEKLYQDYVWVTQTYAVDVASVDAWTIVVQDYITHINSPERYMVFDLSAIPRPSVTRYMNKQVTAMAQANRDARGRVGIVLTLNPMIRYIFFNRNSKSSFSRSAKQH